MTTDPPRAPRAFDTDDPAIEMLVPEPEVEAGPDGADLEPGPERSGWRPSAADLERGLGWGSLLVTSMAGLALLAAGVAFARFVSQALERQDWIGWTATGLLAAGALAAAVLLLGEIIGLLRLSRLKRLRQDVDAALASRSSRDERQAVRRLRALLSGRPDLAWSLARLAKHERDVRDPGDLLRLADREVVAPLDGAARRLIVKAAKRVSVVTALSPMAWVAMLYVVVENVRMIRQLAANYGGRPGGLGALRLARMVVTHIIATGGLALTDDLLGQFLGQDLLRRLSRRLGEGVFNGALTARIGTAAIEVTRPLPFLDAPRIRVRDLLPELYRRPGPPGPT